MTPERLAHWRLTVSQFTQDVVSQQMGVELLEEIDRLNGGESVAMPPGSHGVTGHVISADPPTAVLRFEHGGVLGEDVHDVAESFSVIRGRIDVLRKPVDGGWTVHEDALGGRIEPGSRHRMIAGLQGAVVVASFMVPA